MGTRSQKEQKSKNRIVLAQEQSCVNRPIRFNSRKMKSHSTRTICLLLIGTSALAASQNTDDDGEIDTFEFDCDEKELDCDFYDEDDDDDYEDEYYEYSGDGEELPEEVQLTPLDNVLG